MRVAFVAPFFGAGAAGGAEAECRHTAIRLAASGVEVDVFTTCILDLLHEWNVNYHREGATREDGLTVRRFRVDYTDLGPFFRLNDRLMRGETLTPDEERQFIAMNINSFGLYRALAAEAARYDRVCFIPYFFGTTFHGVRLCPGRAVLIPCLHDEPYARLRVMAELFQRVERVVFHSRAERDLAGRLYNLPDEKGILLGEGIDTDFAADGERFRRRHNLSRPFVLYAGKKDASKNVHTLLDYFARYKRRRPGALALVLIGPSRLPVPAGAEGDVFDLGFVPDQDKKDAYAAATLFCQPSLNESFSIVIMESWVRGRPCLVHGGCAVTREHAVRSGGGLYFESYSDFEGGLDRLLAQPDLRARMGAAGRSYVYANFRWDHIIRRFRREVAGFGV